MQLYSRDDYPFRKNRGYRQYQKQRKNKLSDTEIPTSQQVQTNKQSLFRPQAI